MIEGFSASIANDKPANARTLSRLIPPAKCLLPSTASISGTTGSRQMARHLAAPYLAHDRLFDAAAIRRLRAAWVESATRRQIAQQRRQTGNAGERATLLDRGQCGDQRPRVGVAWF